MPGNAFIQFTGTNGDPIVGESLQTGHEGKNGWIEVGEWSWDVEAETNFLKGTGSAVGKPTSGVLSFSHYYDKSSPTLMQYIVRGTHFKSITLDMLKQTGKDQPELFFQLMAKDVFITKVSSKGGEDGAVTQDVECVFKQVALAYKQQNNDGTLATAKPFNWNIAEMTNATPDLKLTIK